MDIFQTLTVCTLPASLGLKVEVPENGYMGNYMVDLAKEIIAEYGDKFQKLTETRRWNNWAISASARSKTRLKKDLQQLRVEFDVWFREQSLYANGQYDKGNGIAA